MRKFAIIVSILLALVFLAGYGVWSLFDFPSVSYRYRLSIAVEGDGQVHSGSSVIEVKTTFFPKWAAGMANGTQYARTIEGQAVFVDLGVRGALIAALAGENYDYSTEPADALGGRAFLSYSPHNVQGYPVTLENVRAISQMQGRADLTADNMPAFLWFPDPANLATAKEVKPADFASVIGDSTHLVSAQVEITHDPILIDIDKKLPAYTRLLNPPNRGVYTSPTGLMFGGGMFIASEKAK